MWLGMFILPWHYFSHSVCQIFGRGHWSKPWEQAEDCDQGAGTIYLRQGLRDALSPACNLQTVLSTLHWSQLALETGSFSEVQLFFHSHSHSSAHTPTYSAGEHSMSYETDLYFLFVYLFFFIPDEPRTSPCSPHLAVWRPSWGRVTCSLLAWQSASLSRQAASICWPLTANRLDWKRFTPEDDFVCMFPKQTRYDNCCWQVQLC